jgi:uncharacterized protein GlcG (DUF336 family)
LNGSRSPLLEIFASMIDGMFLLKRTQAAYRRPTHALEDGVQKAGFKYLLTLDNVIASRGGIPLMEGGKLIDAIGCSGGTGSQDETVCDVAANTINAMASK